MDWALFIAGFSWWCAVVLRYPSVLCSRIWLSFAPLERLGACEDAPATASFSELADRVIHFGLAAELPATVELGLCSGVVHDVSYDSVSIYSLH